MPSFVRFLGVPSVLRDDRPEDIPPSQALLLIAYLAHCERWLSRPAVAGVFWPDKSEKAARHSLNQLVYTTREQPWAAGLDVERSRLRWAADSDLARFRAGVAQGDWREAVEIYRGDFLASIEADVSADLESWLAEARQELFASWREAALAQGGALLAAAEHAAAAELLERVLQRDALAEDALRLLLRCTLDLDVGARRRALQHFDRFARTLRDELAEEPLPATLDLAERVRARPAAAPPSPAPQPSLRGFPSWSGGFVGREAERADLGALLQRPDARLVTLLGLGGVGKTRLAAQIAEERAGRFADGAVFASLAALDDAEQVPAALLAALGVAGAPDASPRDQLLAHLRERSTLLVLDNLESVIDAAELVQEILETSPASRVLATSREALELPGEHLYDLQGLNFPSTRDETSEDYDAVRLFVRSAQRFRSAFALDADSRPYVFDLCQLLEGSALGLELAASWLRVLSVAEITGEVRTNLDFVATERPDVPPRHRSLRAVFDTSWQLLSDEERRALARLSVFRGGFVRDAAQAVAEVPARTLLGLVNKSLLQRTREGRFERHATVQRFSAERLAADERRRCRQRHAEWFAGLAADFRDATNGPREEAWLVRARADLDNVRAALGYTVDAQETQLGMNLAADLRQFWYRAGLVREGKAFLASLLTHPQDRVDPRLRARCLDASGELHRLSGDFGAARDHFERSLRLFTEAGDERSSVNVHNGLGIAAYLGGDRSAARRAWTEGLALAERLGDANAAANLSVSLGFLAKDDEDYARMSELFERALAIYEAMGHRFAILSARSNLGFAALHRRDFGASLRYQREALAMALELEHDDSIIRCLEDLAALAADLGEAELALRLAAATAARREALKLPIEPHDAATLEEHLGAARAALNEADAARAVERGATMDLPEAARAALEFEFELERHAQRR